MRTIAKPCLVAVQFVRQSTTTSRSGVLLPIAMLAALVAAYVTPSLATLPRSPSQTPASIKVLAASPGSMRVDAPIFGVNRRVSPFGVAPFSAGRIGADRREYVPTRGMLGPMRDAMMPFGSSTAVYPNAPRATWHDWLVLQEPVTTHDDSLAAERQLSADALHAPLEVFFSQYSDNRAIVARVTEAVIRYSRKRGLAPSLVAAVLVTENDALKPRARSVVGAQGLMQVMPFHAGMKGCLGTDLTDVENNICHGTGILADKLRAAKSLRMALLRYNGCVRGANTPNCFAYPTHVLAKAGRVRRQIFSSVRSPELRLASVGYGQPSLRTTF